VRAVGDEVVFQETRDAVGRHDKRSRGAADVRGRYQGAFFRVDAYLVGRAQNHDKETESAEIQPHIRDHPTWKAVQAVY